MKSIFTYIQGTLRRRYLLVLGLTAGIIAIGTFSLIRCNDKIGDPFLGVFFGNDLLIAASQRIEWNGVQAGLKPMDRLVAINGRQFADGLAIFDYLWTLPRQSRLSVSVQRHEQLLTFQYDLQTYNLSDFLVVFAVPGVLGFTFLILGIGAFLARPRYQASLVYFFLCALIALACVIHFEAYSDFALYRMAALMPLIAAVALHLLILFPERSRSRLISKMVRINYFIVLSGIAIKQLFIADATLGRIANILQAAYLGAMILACLIVMLRNYRRTDQAATREKLKVLLIGFVIAAPLPLYWATMFILKQRIFYLDQAMWLFLLFPVFLGYAVLKRNILDIDRVIRVGISYGLLGSLLLGFYLLVVWGMRRVDASLHGVSLSPALIFIIIVTAGVIIAQNIGVVQDAVMRYIFKGRHRIIRTIQEITEELAHTTRIEDVHTCLVDALCERLRLSRVVLMSPAAESSTAAPYQVLRSSGLATANLAGLDCRHLLQLIGSTTVSTIHTLRASPLLKKEVALLLRKNRLRVFIQIDQRHTSPLLLLLGERQADKDFTHETLVILATLARQAGISLENAHLHLADTERERLAALGKVASIIIHDIKNPLGIIKVSSETIRKRLTRDPTAQELLGIIDDEILRMNDTLLQFLNFAKPDHPQLQPLVLARLIEEVAHSFTRQLQIANIAFQVESANEVQDLIIQGDKEKLRRAIYNLMLNAKEALAGTVKPRILLQLTKAGDQLRLRIQDNGPGLEEGQLAAVFEPFYSTKKGNSGLGLAIVRQIVMEHSGHLSVSSQLGHGACFDIVLGYQEPT